MPTLKAKRALASVRRNATIATLVAMEEGAPKILGTRRVVPTLEQYVHGTFDVLVDILVREKTAFGDDWNLDVVWPSGIRTDGHRGSIVAHTCDVGRYDLTVTFEHRKVALRDAFDGAHVVRLAGVDHRGRCFEITQPPPAP